MKNLLINYFSEGQGLKASQKFLDEQGTDVTRYHFLQAIESIPNLEAIKDTIGKRTPLSKNDSERALSIIHEHFHKLEESAPVNDIAEESSVTRQQIKLPPKKHWIRQASIDNWEVSVEAEIIDV